MTTSGTIPHYTLKHGLLTEADVKNVEHLVITVLPVKDQDGWWQAYHGLDDTVHKAQLKMFLLAVEMVHCHDLGTKNCSFSYTDKRRGRFFEALALQERGIDPSNGSRNLLRNGTSWSGIYDTGCITELEQARKRVNKNLRNKQPVDETDKSSKHINPVEQRRILEEEFEGEVLFFASESNPSGHINTLVNAITADSLPDEPENEEEEEEVEEEETDQQVMIIHDTRERIRMFCRYVPEKDIVIVFFASFDPNWNPGKGLELFMSVTRSRQHHFQQETAAKESGQRYNRSQFVEPFVHLCEAKIRKHHPVFNIKHRTYLEMVMDIDGDPEKIDSDYEKEMESEKIDDLASSFNPRNLFGFHKTNTFLSKHHGITFADLGISYSPADKTLSFTDRDNLYYYKYAQIFMFDVHKEYCGLYDQYYPWRAEAVIECEKELLGENYQEGDAEEIKRAEKSQLVRPRPPLVESTVYDPIEQLQALNNLYLKSILQLEEQDRRKKSKQLADFMFNRTKLEWREHGNMVKSVQAMIDEQIKWKDNPPLLPAYSLPNLSTFGSWSARTALNFRYFFLIYGPTRLCFIVFFGSMSAFLREPGLGFHIFIYGRKGSGKSYLVEWMIVKLTPKNMVKFGNEKSKQAETVENDVGLYQLVYIEEQQPWKYKKKLYLQNSELVEREKMKLTSNKVVRDIFQFDNNKRIQKTIETAFYDSQIATGNPFYVNKEDALMDRFYSELFAELKITQLYKRVGGKFAPEVKGQREILEQNYKNFKVLFGIAAMFINTGSLYPVSTDMCDVVFPQMIDYLHEMGVPTDAKRNRERLDKLTKLFAIGDGIIRTFSSPGGEHYCKPFELEQLKALRPQFYVRLEHCLFAWTAMIGQYREEIHMQVISAIDKMENGILSEYHDPVKFCKEKGVDKESKLIFDETRFRTVADTFGFVGERRKNRVASIMVDYNYIRIGTAKANKTNKEILLKEIARNCDNYVNTDQVNKALKDLATMQVTPECGQYDIVSKQMFLNRLGQKMETINGPNTIEFPSKSLEKRIPVVYYNETTGELSIAIAVNPKMHEDIAVDAFMNRCVYTALKERTLVLGSNPKKHNHVFETLTLTKEIIEDYSDGYADLVVENFMFTESIIHNMSGLTSARDKSRENKYITITEDLDEWAFNIHTERYGFVENGERTQNWLNEQVLNFNSKASRISKKTALSDEKNNAEKLVQQKFARADYNYPESIIEAEEEESDDEEDVQPRTRRKRRNRSEDKRSWKTAKMSTNNDANVVPMSIEEDNDKGKEEEDAPRRKRRNRSEDSRTRKTHKSAANDNSLQKAGEEYFNQ